MNASMRDAVSAATMTFGMIAKNSPSTPVMRRRGRNAEHVVAVEATTGQNTSIVDIILTEQVEQTGAGDDAPPITVTSTILENARVLAIDQTFGDVDGIPTLTGSTATMELTQDQAELLARSSRVGSLSLTLRSAADAGFNQGEALANVDSLDRVKSGTGKVMIYRSNQVEAGGS